MQLNEHLRRRMLVVLLALLPLRVTAGPAGETLYDFEGRPHALEEFLGKGKWLIVTVWASDCATCNREIHEMVAFHKAHDGDNASVLGISVDGPGGKNEALAFIERHRIGFPNLLDDGTAFRKIYLRSTGRPWFGGTPMNLLYAPDGELVARRIGALARTEVEAFIANEARETN